MWNELQGSILKRYSSLLGWFPKMAYGCSRHVATLIENVNVENLDLEPHEDMEFDSREAAYSFYKEYAKSIGFGTAKLSSRRSRASKEFIDAKFSCIRYGNKQQSDDAINPRPSPKIGCKASLHVKRNPNGKWSWTEEQFDKRWWKLLEKFKLRDDEWLRLLYEDRVLWVPVFMKGVSLAGLSTASRGDSLNSSFDKYIDVETSLREFIEQYKLLLEDRYEEEAKAEFDAWHETPELKSPSPFEKQMSLVYTREILQNFQAEVLGAAACHLKKEKEDGTSVTYAVKDFEIDQDFMVEWNEPKSDICCSCRLFEYRGYLCRHAIVVLQMSGVFSIPHKYILQRWTNAALSRHGISEKLDDLPVKVRRYNDLCRRAIILGEEGSLSQESYNIAVSAIKEALQQCASVNISVDYDPKSTTNGSLNKEESQGIHSTPTKKTPKRTKAGKEKAGDESNVNTRGKVPLDQEVSTTTRTQDSFPHMELSNTRPAHLRNMVPGQFPSAAPSMFQSMAPMQFHDMTLRDKHPTQ
ncbi:hypothetical protein Nepgr_013336 [Nepenthes gracilis]|uniref:Protein FAR1-RELATED SEQUENCE n=1 Tax=Nepenthes gracilis TaxID=150966 RepID=A0AAD3SH89_NEPGR|nr:hypothetical protein Nepgr_013336 [Nepenthes gracilis]